MKQIYFFLFISFLHQISFAQTIYPSGVGGCIARWTFDVHEGGSLSTIVDESGNNNHGINNNISSSNSWKGILNASGKFNGMNSWSEVAHATNLNCSTEITMLALVKFNSFNNKTCQYNQILSKGYPHFIHGNYGIGVGDSPFDSDCNSFNPNNVQLMGQIGLGTLNVSPGNYLDLNKWYFLAISISPTTLKNYLVHMNPSFKETSISPINSIANANNIGVNLQNISIGKHLNPSFEYYVDCDMDEVILFNKELTASEIYSIYEFLYGYSPTSTLNIQENNNILIKESNKQIYISSKSSNYKYEIYNNVGQIVLKKDNCQFSETVDCSFLFTQMYLIRVIEKNGKTTLFKANFI